MTHSQKSAMVFAPHQDDETLGCGGMIALKREQKVPVWVVFLADGQGSHRNHPRIQPKELIQIRKQEAVNALTTLGVELSAIHFLDQPDGSLSKLLQEEQKHTLERLIQLLRALKPQEVYVPYRKDGQPDHEAAYALVQAAILESKVQVELLQYPIWAMWYPWRFEIRSQELANAYRLPLKQVWDKKRRALEAYRSQCLPLAPESESSLPPNFLKLFLSPNEIFFKARE
jgi:LmbE family N-acetylglucosaminyl deacetylase